MEHTGTCGANGREEIGAAKARVGVLDASSVPGKENVAVPRSIATADHVSFKVDGSIRVSAPGRVAVLLTVVRKVSHRVTIPSWGKQQEKSAR